MVDSGATGNFMSRTLVERKEYSTQEKSDAYNFDDCSWEPIT